MSEPRWIKMRNGWYFCVDDEDYDFISSKKWHMLNAGYPATWGLSKNGKTTSVTIQKILMNPDKGMSVDHIDGNKLNNMRSNLRICSHSQNLMNQKKQEKRKYKGAYKNRRGNKWFASIIKNGINYRVYGFKTAEEAALAYNEMAIQHFGEFARLNEVPQC